MNARTSEQAGFTLVEVLIVMVIGVSLLAATLFTFERLVTHSNESDRLNETAEQARNGLEIEARQLRNLAKRVNNVAVISTVQPDDFVFQTSDPSKTWVRYCLDTSLGTANARVWEQTQTANTPGSTGRCGPSASGWQRTINVAQNVVNRINGRNAPLFSYRCVSGGTACTASATTWDQIIGVDAQVIVDTTPNRAPAEMKVDSAVFLRNQNQAPVAVVNATPVASRTIKLNASGSSDFEGRTLEYYWFLGSMPSAIQCNQPTETVTNGVTKLWGGTYLGRGVVLQYTWPGTTPASGAGQTVGLVACDPGDRYGFSGPINVQIP